MNPTVSVALCTYNGARFVAQQVRSILDQSVLPNEIVVSDDGSTDATLSIIEGEVAANGAGISTRFLRGTAPLGVTGNFERAIRATTGDLVVLSDQDDMWHRDRVAVASAAFERDPKLLLWHGDARLVDEAGVDLGFSLYDSLGTNPQEIASINAGEALAQYLRRNLVTGATTAFRHSMLDAALPFPREWVHDEWLGAIAAATGRVHASSRQIIDYRQHSSNEIGVVRPSLAYRARRMLEPRGGRYTGFARRAAVLADRLDRLGVDESVRGLVERKRDFELRRAGYPPNRLARIRPVLAGLHRGDYAEFSSQGNLDVVRDLIQPAGVGTTE